MTRSYIDSRLARRLRHGRKKQTGLVLGRSVFSIARRVRLPGRPAGASVGGYTAHASRPSRPSNREKKRVQCRSAQNAGPGRADPNPHKVGTDQRKPSRAEQKDRVGTCRAASVTIKPPTELDELFYFRLSLFK
ncbi:hypothetical protein J6590_099708 [Homalodisca vitripennis]|nr:hypothetical protein J6590_099708 [Homalodisca vitripennis]